MGRPVLRTLRSGPRTLGLPNIRRVQMGNTATRLTGKRGVQRRQRILSVQPLCVTCLTAGRITIARELDHRVPLWESGPETEANLDPLCRRCHVVKTAAEAVRRYGGNSVVRDQLPVTALSDTRANLKRPRNFPFP